MPSPFSLRIFVADDDPNGRANCAVIQSTLSVRHCVPWSSRGCDRQQCLGISIRCTLCRPPGRSVCVSGKAEPLKASVTLEFKETLRMAAAHERRSREPASLSGCPEVLQ